MTLSINPAPGSSLDEITHILSIAPTSQTIEGQVPINRRNSKREARHTAWFLESESLVDTSDVNDHIDWLINRLDGKEHLLRELIARGCAARIWCYWLSALGHGGPILTSRQMGRLSMLGLDICFDVYGTI